MPPLLSVKKACKSYGAFKVLDNASFELAAGEVHALMGENGAGKTTLIKLLAGVVRPDSLELRIKDKPVQIHSAAEAYQHGLRFIHQELSVVPQLSVAENLFLSRPYPKRFGLLAWRRLNQQAKAMLAALGIGHIAPECKMARLSTGDKMLVKLAASLLGEASESASIFVLDEPTAALNKEESQKLFALIAQLKARACGFVYVSHRLEEIFQLCDRVTVMRDGLTVASKAVADTHEAELIQLMTGREVSQLYARRKQAISPEPLLEVRALRTKKLSELKFKVHKGEILGLAGLSGSGRSEVLRAIMGIDPSQIADMLWEGAPFRPLSVRHSWQKGMAFVPEERRAEGLILGHSIENNIALAHWQSLSYGGVLVNTSAARRKAQVLAERLRLKARGPSQKLSELSGGNQQKVVFARALAASPRLLLLDEPSRGIDVGAKEDIYSFIRSLSDEGVAIVLASSDLAELLGLCDRILVLHQGKQIALLDAAGLSQADVLHACYQNQVKA